ncbi:DUF805 domain-containing protein [Nocardioides KLBMP 9356]|uniref:DUF805 domain-containing protein n=2 Tax=Nocardioides potassii TaxID=2911371 RepID=A0ABS9HFZ0_9ACTN|nr:DUF805 domain-containing protein [Nocardioides potassii]
MTAVRTCFSKYVDFSGRARRSEYWYFTLFNIILSVVASFIDAALSSQVVGLLVTLALFLPGLAVSVRRLHDTDRSGWWILIGLIPIVGWIVLIVWYCTDSKPDNRFGPNPKNAGYGAAYDGSYPPPPPPPYGSGQYGS